MVKRPSRLIVKQGRYGKSKVKAFTVMKDAKWYSVKHLCLTTGISYPSLGRTVSRWFKFDYIDKATATIIGGRYVYRLTDKGKRWLSLARAYLPNYQLFIDELEGWKSFISDDEVQNLLCMHFSEFVAALNTMIKAFKNNNGKNH